MYRRKVRINQTFLRHSMKTTVKFKKEGPMSALVVGSGSWADEVGSRLFECGFDEVLYKNGDASLHVDGFRPDAVIVVKEALKGVETRSVLRKVGAIGAPVFIW